MDFAATPGDIAFRRELVAFLEAALPPDWEEISKGGPGSAAQVEFSRGFCARLAERGWLTQHWPAAYGGRDASSWRHAILGEELWSRGEPRGPQYMNVNWIGPTLLAFGSEPQQREHLPRKVWTDCVHCPKRHACDEVAVEIELVEGAVERARADTPEWRIPVGPNGKDDES